MNRPANPEAVPHRDGHREGYQPQRPASGKEDQVPAIKLPGGRQVAAGPGVQNQLQGAQQDEGNDEASRVAGDGAGCAGRQAYAEQHGGQEGTPVCGIAGFMAIGVEGQLHPQPPNGRKDEREEAECGQRRVILQHAGELTDRSGENQVEEKLEPAGVSFVAVVAIGCPQ